MAGIVVASAGVVAAGVGVYVGLQVGGLRSQVTNPQTDAQGRITSITQRQAFQIQNQANMDAVVADVLMIGGLALAAGGAALVLLSDKGGGETVSVSTTGRGAALTARF